MNFIQQFLQKIKTLFKPIWDKKIIKVPLMVILIILALFLSSKLTDVIVKKEVEDPKFGVTFVKNYADEYDLDWKETFLALLNDLEIKHYRLVSYWSNHEKQNNQYDFSDLDWQMDQVAKKNGTVDLAIGFRQPRWPECHQPDWAKSLEKEQWEQELYQYIEKVVNRYKDHPALARYQLENEAMNSWVGECAIERDRLIKEFNLVKELDPNHPVAMSLSDQHGFPANQPKPDAYGFSVYQVVYNKLFPGPTYYVTYPTPIWYHQLRSFLIQKIKDQPTFIHELQMEPWGPKPNKEMTIEEQNRSMSESQIHKNFDFGTSLGMEEIYLWGGEWWYWRKEKLNDPTIWEAVRENLKNYE